MYEHSFTLLFSVAPNYISSPIPPHTISSSTCEYSKANSCKHLVYIHVSDIVMIILTTWDKCDFEMSGCRTCTGMYSCDAKPLD